MNTISIDGLNEDEFRRAIEGRLRCGRPGEAVERLRRLLAPFAGEGGILPARFLTVSADELAITGWDGLGAAIQRYDRSGRPITALGITFAWPGEELPKPDSQGLLRPMVEVGYYSDDAFPFSQSGRDDLLDGYSFHGCTWASDCEASDNALGLDGIDDLNGALALLEARLLDSEEPDEDEIRAGSLGACLLSVLLFQAVDEQVKRTGLPRPLCVMAGSNGVYPYFDAPVVGVSEDVRRKAEAAEEEETVTLGAPPPRYSSLLVTGIARAPKRAALVLEETEAETAVRISRLRGLAHGETEAAPPRREEPTEPAILPAAAVAGSPLMTKKAPGHSWDFRDMLTSPPPAPSAIPDEPDEPEGPFEPFEPTESLEPFEPEEPDQPSSGPLPVSFDFGVPDLPVEPDPVEDLVPRPQFALFESFLQPQAIPAPLQPDSEPEPEFETEFEPVSLETAPPEPEPEFEPLAFEPELEEPEPEFVPVAQQPDPAEPEFKTWVFEPAPQEPELEVAVEPLPRSWALGLAWAERNPVRSKPKPRPEQRQPVVSPVISKARPGLLGRLRAWWAGTSL